MNVRRVPGANSDVQMTTMSTKATAFMIDELLRPRLLVSDNRQHDNAAHESLCGSTCNKATCTGKHRVDCLCNIDKLQWPIYSFTRNARPHYQRTTFVADISFFH